MFGPNYPSLALGEAGLTSCCSYLPVCTVDEKERAETSSDQQKGAEVASLRKSHLVEFVTSSWHA